MKEMGFNIASFTAFKDSYKKEVIQSNIGKTTYEIDVILEEMYIAYINKELNINVSTLKEAVYKRHLARIRWKYGNDPDFKKRIDACGKKYRAANKEKLAAYRKEYHAANKEKIAASNKEYYAANKEKIAASNKEYYAANKEKISVRCKKYYADNKEKYTAWHKEYYDTNKDKICAQKKEYRMRKKKKKK